MQNKHQKFGAVHTLADSPTFSFKRQKNIDHSTRGKNPED